LNGACLADLPGEDNCDFHSPLAPANSYSTERESCAILPHDYGDSETIPGIAPEARISAENMRVAV
jgi:hypothetical protein